MGNNVEALPFSYIKLYKYRSRIKSVPVMMKRASDQPSPPLKHAKRDPSPPPAPDLDLLKSNLNKIKGIKIQKPSKDTLVKVYYAVAIAVDHSTDNKEKDTFIEKAQVEGSSFFDVLKRAAHEDASKNDLEALIHHGMWHFYYVMNCFMNDLQMHFRLASPLNTSVRLFNLPIACSRLVMLFSHR